jgi:hypothetical protein
MARSRALSITVAARPLGKCLGDRPPQTLGGACDEAHRRCPKARPHRLVSNPGAAHPADRGDERFNLGSTEPA